MPAVKVWGDFTQLSDRSGVAKQGSDRVETFARWQCPHCPVVVEALAADAKDKKSVVCARHFWGSQPCPNRPADDLRGQPKAKEAKVVDVMREQHSETMAQGSERNRLLQEQLDVQKRSERHLAAICGALGLSDHSSDDEEKLTRRAKRKMDDMATTATTAAYAHVAQAGKFSPPRDGEPVVAIGRRVYENVATATAQACRVPALCGQMHDVHDGLSIDRDAPPAKRTHAIHTLVRRAADVPRLHAERKHAEQHFDAIGAALGLPSNASREEQVDAIGRLNKSRHVAQMAQKGSGGGTKEVKVLKRDLANAQEAISQLNDKFCTANAVNDCFDSFRRNPKVARTFLRKMSVHAHPDKHGGCDCPEGELASGLQAALNVVKDQLS